ncbi:MAG: DUF3592 domain-containing protein [Planctomycetota bacterium]
MGCLVLFGAPFAAFGVFMGWQLLSLIGLAVASESWVKTPATLISVKLQGSDTRKVVAEYDYEYAGEKYRGEQVGLDDTADNFSSYHRELYERLKERLDAELPVDCYVDGDDPSRAVLDRTLRPVLVWLHGVFALIFGGAGFGMIGTGAYSVWDSRRHRARLAQFPDEPWRVREDWAAGEIRSGGWKSVWFLGAFALFWNLISWTVGMGVVAGGKADVPWFAGAMIGGFLLIGLWLIAAVGWKVITLFRSGGSVFKLAGPTGVVGGELAGVVLAPQNVQPKEALRLTLACQETRTRSRGGESETEVRTVWEDSRLVDRTLHDPSGRRGVPVRFVIPSGKRPTDPDGHRPVAWKLTVSAETSGPDYEAEFEVPVFVTADSKEGVEAPTGALTDYESVETLAEALARTGLVCEHPSETELRVVKPHSQHLGMAAGLLVGGLVFGGAAIGLAFVEETLVRYLFPVCFGAAGIGMLVGSVGTVLSSSDLHIVGDRWRLKSGWYGFRGAGREFSAGDVKRIRVKESMSSSSGTETVQWNHIVANLNDGGRAILLRGIKDRNAERRLLGELCRLAGIDAPPATDDEDA